MVHPSGRNAAGERTYSRNYLCDVTPIVASLIGQGSGGVVSIPVTPAPHVDAHGYWQDLVYDGLVLIVIYEDNQAVLTPRAVTVFYGFADQGGDSFDMELRDPAASDVRVDMSLGIAYSDQSSTPMDRTVVRVNDQLVSSSAGGTDDVVMRETDGPAITVGDMGGSVDSLTARPDSPTQQTGGSRTDDELYRFGSSVVPVGSRDFRVGTENPSLDDNLFVAVVDSPPVSVVPVAVPVEQTWGCDCEWGRAPGFVGLVADPVSTVSGSLMEHVVDVTVGGTGVPMVFSRTYNGGDGVDGPLGVGWTHGYNASVSEDVGSGRVVVRDPTGAHLGYSRLADGSYRPDPG